MCHIFQVCVVDHSNSSFLIFLLLLLQMLITFIFYCFFSSQDTALLFPSRILDQLQLQSRYWQTGWNPSYLVWTYVSFLLAGIFWTTYLSHSSEALKPAFKQHQVCSTHSVIVFDQCFRIWSRSSEIFCKHHNHQALWDHFLIWFWYAALISFMQQSLCSLEPNLR